MTSKRDDRLYKISLWVRWILCLGVVVIVAWACIAEDVDYNTTEVLWDPVDNPELTWPVVARCTNRFNIASEVTRLKRLYGETPSWDVPIMITRSEISCIDLSLNPPTHY